MDKRVTYAKNWKEIVLTWYYAYSVRKSLYLNGNALRNTGSSSTVKNKLAEQCPVKKDQDSDTITAKVSMRPVNPSLIY